jgi:hypothetical protein
MTGRATLQIVRRRFGTHSVLADVHMNVVESSQSLALSRPPSPYRSVHRETVLEGLDRLLEYQYILSMYNEYVASVEPI